MLDARATLTPLLAREGDTVLLWLRVTREHRLGGSALARNQVLAAIFSGVIIVAVLIAHLLARVTDRPLKDMFMALALYARHFPPFQIGAIHIRDVVYYVAVTYVALFAAIRVMEARRWK